MLKNILLVILMGLVTYLPRMIPIVLLNNLKLTPFWKRFFHFIPFATLSALIFPGVLSSTGDIQSAIAGTSISFLLAFYRLNIVLVLLGGILGVIVFETII